MRWLWGGLIGSAVGFSGGRMAGLAYSAALGPPPPPPLTGRTLAAAASQALAVGVAQGMRAIVYSLLGAALGVLVGACVGLACSFLWGRSQRHRRASVTAESGVGRAGSLRGGAHPAWVRTVPGVLAGSAVGGVAALLGYNVAVLLLWGFVDHYALLVWGLAAGLTVGAVAGLALALWSGRRPGPEVGAAEDGVWPPPVPRR